MCGGRGGAGDPASELRAIAHMDPVNMKLESRAFCLCAAVCFPITAPRAVPIRMRALGAPRP